MSQDTEQRQDLILDLLRSNRLLRPNEVALILGCSPGAVRAWSREGKLEAFTLGDGPKAPIRITPASLARFLEPRSPA